MIASRDRDLEVDVTNGMPADGMSVAVGKWGLRTSRCGSTGITLHHFSAYGEGGADVSSCDPKRRSVADLKVPLLRGRDRRKQRAVGLKIEQRRFVHAVEAANQNGGTLNSD